MLERHRVAFGDTISQAAVALCRQLIETTGSNHLEVSSSDRVNFDPPPLRPCPPLHGIPLHLLPVQIYAVDLTVDQLLTTWNRDFALALLNGRDQEVNRSLKRLFPDVIFAGSVAEKAVQFLYLAVGAMRGLRLHSSPNSLVLTFRGGSGEVMIGIGGSTVYWLGREDMQCKRRGVSVDVNAAMTQPLGMRRQSKVTTGALYTRLSRVMPTLADQIDTVFGAAVAAGPEYEDMLLAPFDIEFNGEAEDSGSEDIWSTAVDIVLNARHNPLPELYRLLRVHVGYEAFKTSLGDPYRAVTGYRPSTRSRHMQALITLRDSFPARKSPAAEANALLQFQQMIGGSRVE